MEIIALKNTVTKIKNLMDELSSTMELTEDRMSNVGEGLIEFTQSEQQEKTDYQGSVEQQQNIRYSYQSPRIRREKQAERVIREIIAEYFPKLMNNINILIQEDVITPNMINPKKSMPRHIIRLLKN